MFNLVGFSWCTIYESQILILVAHFLMKSKKKKRWRLMYFLVLFLAKAVK